VAVILASATFGFPPFYLTTLVAGALRIGFGTFLAAGFLGRLLHFGAIAMAPGHVGGMVH
jgi:membrane protein YqaA with SNARE-associated domain